MNWGNVWKPDFIATEILSLMGNNLYTLKNILQHASIAEYKGFNKHDGLLSPLLRLMFGWNKIGRLLAIQIVTRAPINIRPSLAVPKTINPKGIGLFAKANLDAFELTHQNVYLKEAEILLEWLIANGNTNFPGLTFGYQYPWQDVGFYAPAYFPNRVVTCWIGYAFFRAWELTGKQVYLRVCREICIFLRDTENKIVDTGQELCFSYVPDKRVTWAVMDVSALCAKMFALTGTALKDKNMLHDAERSMKYIVNRQTDYGAWFYTDPPKDSHITHDNYHTGIILDCLLDYMLITGNQRFLPNYQDGLDYYREQLFLANGAPKWMNNKIWPHDIHGAAQGVITFSKASSIDQTHIHQAEKILAWTYQNLFNEAKNVFWYQKTRWITKRFNLLRWCQAWMAYALTEYLIAREKIDV